MTSETVNLIIQFVNGCGFPIAACVGMAAFIVWTKKQNIENRKYNFNMLNAAVENNTKALEQLTQMIERGYKRD